MSSAAARNCIVLHLFQNSGGVLHRNACPCGAVGVKLGVRTIVTATMPYEPNADDLLPEEELERRLKLGSNVMDAIHKMLFDLEASNGTLPIGADREALQKELAHLDRRQHQLTAARGRRTYKREHGHWPNLD
jgi:hypothetical protein